MRVGLIQGASGGIGRALTEQVLQSERFDRLIVTGRNLGSLQDLGPQIEAVALDLTDDASIQEAAQRVRQLTDRLHLVICTAGLLKSEERAVTPEKKLADLTRQSLFRVFDVNCFGPFLWYAALNPLFRHREPLTIATLSARVGSIGDNRLGGWHSYRASKAAQNMLTKNLSIELSRTNPHAVVIGVHPGTVDTALSKPFQSGVAPEKLFSPDQSAKALWTVISNATPNQSGAVLAWDGSTIVP